MELGFRILTAAPGSLRCAVSPRQFIFGVSVSLIERAVVSNRFLLNSLIPSTISKKDYRPLISMTNKPQRKCSVIKEDDVKSELVDIQNSRDGLEKVAVHPRCTGESYQVTNEQVSYEMKPTCGEGISSERKASKSSSKDYGKSFKSSSEESGLRRSKRRAKQDPIENKTVKIDTKVGKLSVNAGEFSGMKASVAKRKKSLEAVSEDVEPADGVGLCMKQDEPWTVLAHKKPQKDWVPYNPKIMRPPPLSGNKRSVKLISWNVNGLRALLKSEASSASQLAQREGFDILCLQETKLQEKDVEAMKHSFIDDPVYSFWTCSVSKLGYSGAAIISRIEPLSVRYGLGIADHDSEGRIVTVEFGTFYLLSAYVPNSGDGLKRLSYRVTQWDPSLSSYIKELEKSKPVILTGDLNCAYEEIDIYNPAGNKRSAGFTVEERESFGANFLSRGFVDTFRKQHPGVVGYTYWGYRHGARKTNRGWRLDYFLVSESIADKVHDSYILPDINGSDHCPIGLVLKL